MLAQPFCALSEVSDETLKADVAVMKTDIAVMKTDIAVMKTELKNLKDTINDRFDTINNRFDTTNNRFDTFQNTIQKSFDRQNNIIIACIGLPMAILAIGATVWGILTHKRGIRDSSTQQQEIETLKQEIETLKRRHIVNP